MKMSRPAANMSHRTANINEKRLHCLRTYGRQQQTRRTKTANITKDDTTSQHSDMLAMCCEVISSFVIFAVLVPRLCCCRLYKVL